MATIKKIDIEKIKMVDLCFDNLSIKDFDELLEECGINDVPSKESDLMNQVYESFEKEV